VSSVGLAAPVKELDASRTTPGRRRLVTAGSLVALFGVDVVVVAGAFILAYVVRFVVSDAVATALPLSQYVRTGLAVGIAAATLLALQGLGDFDRRRSWPTRLRVVTSAISTGTILAVVFSFDHDQQLSRAWLAIGWSLAITLLGVWRSVAPSLYLLVRRRLTWRPRLVIVGANVIGQELGRELESTFEILGYVDNGTDLPEPLDRPLLGPIAELESVVRASDIDEIVIALPPQRREQIDRVVARGFGRQVDVKLLTEFDASLPARVEFGRLGSRPYIGFAPVARVTWVKRAADLTLATAALVVASPLFLAVAIAIKIESRGPVFYRQRRLGKDSVPFEIIKFRSMGEDAEHQVAVLSERNEATGPLFKMRRDPRVTRVGRLLRRCSLDELPQLLNVLRGEMSLVGPRPPLPSEVAKYEDWQLARLRALPGMTGLWQVSGRSEVPFNDMVRLDLHYVRNWSLGLDLEIIMRTIPAVLANRGAY
jgi:exopolysaccharide biosynthesis polyprenyl glycosylphosphotransferase